MKFEFYDGSADDPELIYEALTGINDLIGQTFTVGTVGPNAKFNVSSVKLTLRKNSEGPGNVVVQIVKTSDNKPDTSFVMASGSVGIDKIELTRGLVEIPMSSFFQLEKNTQYAIVVSSDVERRIILASYSTASYPNGGYAIYEGTWVLDTGADMLFEVYGNVSKKVMTSPNEGEYAKTKIGQMTKKRKTLVNLGVAE